MSLKSPSIPLPGTARPEAPERALKVDLAALTRTPGFRLAVAVALAIGVLFWPVLQHAYKQWIRPDSELSHGPLVPLLSLYILYHRWDKLKELPARPSVWPLFLLVPVGYAAYVGARTEMMFLLSVLLVATIGLTTWAIAGFRIAWKAAPAILFLLFGLPVWSLIIDKLTQPMQVISTNMAETLLRVMGYQMFKADSTTLLLPNFEMSVGAPCSGLKLIIALVALMTFFLLIADLKWYSNLALALFTIPLAVVTNGVRIAMIGVVGNTYGSQAGHDFHDYSGYIALVLCFLVLQRLCRMFGWK